MAVEILGPLEQGVFLTETSRITQDSVVYSLGVGDTIEWDKVMMARFGCTIYAFDPDPLAIAWLSQQTLSEKFVFTPVGVGPFDGEQVFYQPWKQHKVNKSTIRKTPFVSTLPVKRLQTLMKERGHDHIDILKVNIEGGEYAILSDIIRVAPEQVIIEFHHRYLRHTGWFYTQWAFVRLWVAGFRCVGIDDCLFTYIRY